MTSINSRESRQPDMVADIEEFSKKFRLMQLPEPGFLPREYMLYRISFLEEEILELFHNMCDEDLEGALDSLIDFVYVALGTAHLMNLPFEEGWARVHAANMRKVKATESGDARSKRNSKYDVVKPEGWQPPQFKDLL